MSHRMKTQNKTTQEAQTPDLPPTHPTSGFRSTTPTRPTAAFSPQSYDELVSAVTKCLELSSVGKNTKAFNRPHGTINEWDVSRVTNMHLVFREAYFFNQDLSKWGVSRVTNMRGMFMQATSFNQDVSKWDVSRVTEMDEMFYEAESFKQTLCGETWVNSKASKNEMFSGSPGSISRTTCGA